MLQTFFLNMFFGGKLKGMPPKLVSDDGRASVIRPLAYVAEKDLTRWAEARSSPSSPATCAAARRTCSASRWARCCASGRRTHPGRIEMAGAPAGPEAVPRWRCTPCATTDGLDILKS
jgi:tRNA 2-thiocytidine biosynthesis protein TtcA